MKGKHAYLLHVLRDRMIYPDLRRAVLQQAQLHDATSVYIEDYASGTQLVQELRAEGHGKFHPVKHTQAKKERMVNQTALIENGFVHLPMEAQWLAAYTHELSVFPRGKYDDQVNSASQALDQIHRWTAGRGLYEMYRQERRAPGGCGKPTLDRQRPGVPLAVDMEGLEHRPQADGLFHLKRAVSQRYEPDRLEADLQGDDAAATEEWN